MSSDTVRQPNDETPDPPTSRPRLRPIAQQPAIAGSRYFEQRTRSTAETALLRALLALQGQLRGAGDNLGFLLNVSMDVGSRRVELDFLVCYRGRVFGIEVDGPQHKGRYVQDRSRDQLVEDAGLVFVRRIDVADTDNPAELERFLRTCLGRLLW